MLIFRKNFLISTTLLLATSLLIVFAQSSEAGDSNTTAAPPPSANSAATASTASPVSVSYTSDQATSGKQFYTQFCAVCHGTNLQGLAGPALVGASFQTEWEGSESTAYALFSFISTNMPHDNPGSLTTTQYIDILAYVLQQNAWPVGTVPLPTDKETLSAMKLTISAP